MAKTSERLTKARVRDEIRDMRKRVTRYLTIHADVVEAEYRAAFKGDDELRPILYMRRALVVAATYHLTNVLGVG